MLRAGFAAIILSAICAGCANETLPTPGAFAVQSFNLMPAIAGGDLPSAQLPVGMASTSADTAPGSETVDLSAEQTMAGRVLTAIALERVTGRKPDPAALTAYR